jgi:hypothetical protein
VRVPSARCGVYAVPPGFEGEAALHPSVAG